MKAPRTRSPQFAALFTHLPAAAHLGLSNAAAPAVAAPIRQRMPRSPACRWGLGVWGPWGFGTEMARHADVGATGLPVFFAPHSPSKRGSNENLNRIVRKYFPEGVEISSDPTYSALRYQ